MIQITPQMRILLALEPIDFRRGIDGLAAICRQILNQDPLSGTLFVFCGRSRQSIKILVYDSQGLWLCQKRLSSGAFSAWPKTGAKPAQTLTAHQLYTLLWNGDPSQSNTAPIWKPLNLGS
jgi:transposase